VKTYIPLFMFVFVITILASTFAGIITYRESIVIWIGFLAGIAFTSGAAVVMVSGKDKKK
jgi:hypothetical protein